MDDVRPCARCGCDRDRHEHYRAGTECSECADCPSFRWFMFRFPRIMRPRTLPATQNRPAPPLTAEADREPGEAALEDATRKKDVNCGQ